MDIFRLKESFHLEVVSQMEEKKVVVDRREWGRGEDNPRLLRVEDNKKCCLGFMCLQHGATEDDIRGAAYPGVVANKLDMFARLDFADNGPYNSQFTYDAADINDNTRINDEARERELTELFRSHGWTIEFTN